MTLAEHLPPTLFPDCGALSLEIGWTCSARACCGLLGVDASAVHHHDSAALTVGVESDGSGFATVEVWIEAGERRRTVMRGLRLPCVSRRDGGYTHVDVRQGSRCVLAVSIDGPGRPRYARTDLLGRLGLKAGAYDPPAIRRLVLPSMTGGVSSRSWPVNSR